MKKSTHVVPLLGLAVSGLAGCSLIPSVGPSYTEPEVKSPEHFDALGSDHQEGTVVELPVDVRNWWGQFSDETLNAVMSLSTTKNFDVRIAESRVREARAQAGIATSQLTPQIDATGGFSRTRQSENSFSNFGEDNFGGGIQNRYRAAFDSSWEIDIFGGLRREREAALAALEASEATLADARITFYGETIREYFITRSLEKRLEIAKKNIATQAESLDLVNARFSAGLVSELDVAQAESSLEQTRASIPLLEEAYAASLARLTVLTGTDLATLKAALTKGRINAAESRVARLPVSLPVGIPSELLRRRPDIRAAERSLAAATANIGAAVADWFPRFSFTGSFGVESEKSGSLFDSGSRAWSVGPAVRWPIFAGGRIIYNVRVQNERQAQALAQYEKTVLSAFSETESVLTAYVQQRNRFEALTRALKASNRALELSQELYKQGVSDFQRVLDAQRNVFASEDSLAISEQELLVGIVAIYKTLGGDWLAEIVPPTA